MAKTYTTRKANLVSPPTSETDDVISIKMLALQILESIPDDTLVIHRTKSGTVSLNRRGIHSLACKGMTGQDIADVFGVTKEVILNHFHFEITSGQKLIGPKLKHNLLKQAMYDKPNPALLLFALKNYTNLTDEGVKMEDQDRVTGASWNVELKITKPNVALTDEERQEINVDLSEIEY